MEQNNDSNSSLSIEYVNTLQTHTVFSLLCKLKWEIYAKHVAAVIAANSIAILRSEFCYNNIKHYWFFFHGYLFPCALLQLQNHIPCLTHHLLESFKKNKHKNKIFEREGGKMCELQLLSRILKIDE